MSMRGKFSFREPLFVDDDGLYITAGQMQFFLNRPNGQNLFEDGDAEFLIYLTQCKIFNLVYDQLERTKDEEPPFSDEGMIYWDQNTECIGYAFPSTGDIADKIEETEIFSITGKEQELEGIFVEEDDFDDDDDEDDDDPFGLFLDD